MKPETKILCRLFKALDNAKVALGEATVLEIKGRLSEGSMRTEMAKSIHLIRVKELLQGKPIGD